MRLFLFSFCFFLMVSCQNKTDKLKKPSFLIGSWIRLNDKEGSQTYETWNTNFTGNGFTLKDKDTIFKETLSIVTLKEALYLKVLGVNETPTLFKFTQQTDTSFVCKNPQNEFPKKIQYYLENEQLKAIVSTDDFKIYFVFDRLNKNRNITSK